MSMLRIYYHLYAGPSWRQVWDLHRPLLQHLCNSHSNVQVVVCVAGGPLRSAALWDGDVGQFELRLLRAGAVAGAVNEFHTLQQLQRDARDANQHFDHCAYMHSKGSSSSRLSAGGAAWSAFLATSLLGALPHFARVVDSGFSALGSNLAWGIFEDFGPPRLHYSGNFWCSTRTAAMTARDIRLGGREAAVRHGAEWWLSTSDGFEPFNLFSTGVDHYRSPPECIDWTALQGRTAALAAGAGSGSGSDPLHATPRLQQVQARHAFIATMLRQATGAAPLRAAFSDALLAWLPHHRVPRLLSAHDALMKRLGSRKSSYFYCPESG